MPDQILIHNATICTFGETNQVLEDGAVLVENGQVAAVGKAAESACAVS